MTEQAITETVKPVQLGVRTTHSCGAWWTGTRVSHCGATQCHRTFSSTTAFDRHQRNRPEGGVECLDPAGVGLVPVAKPYGVLWSWPASDGNPYATHEEVEAA